MFVVNGGAGTADKFICGLQSVDRLHHTLARCEDDGCAPADDGGFGI